MGKNDDGVDVILDFHCELFVVKPKQKVHMLLSTKVPSFLLIFPFTFFLSSSSIFPVDQDTEEDDYDYVMFGKVYKYEEEKATSRV